MMTIAHCNCERPYHGTNPCGTIVRGKEGPGQREEPVDGPIRGHALRLLSGQTPRVRVEPVGD